MEFKVEIVGDYCQTIAKQRVLVLSEEWCSDFRFELCMLLPQLLLQPAEPTVEKRPNVIEKSFHCSCY